jgi:hypothetical protein
MVLKYFLVIVSLSGWFASLSQNPEEWQALSFESPEDYKNNEDKILECANFVLTGPAEPTDPARKSAMSALSKWMSGTPDHSFVIDESISKLMEKNEAVLSIYMAAMTKYTIENKDKKIPPAELKLNAFEQLLNYSETPNNKVPMTKDLKKAIEAKRKGKLKEYLKI